MLKGGAIQNPKQKSRYNMLKGGGGQFEILKNPGYRLL